MRRGNRAIISIAIGAWWGMVGEVPSVQAQGAINQVHGQWVNAGAGVRSGVLGSFITYALPTESLEQGHWYLKAVPGYFRDSGSNDGKTLAQFNAQGAGMSVRFLYALSDHWGVGFQGVYARTASGSAQQISFGSQGFEAQANSRLSLPLQLSAYSAMAEVVYDPMSGPGFRLPMLFGLSLSTIDATTEGTFQFQGNSFYAKNKTLPLLSPGVVAGIAPQESWGPFRFIPFAVGMYRFDKFERFHRLVNVTTGEVSESRDEPLRHASLHLGITLKYVPWDLAVSYVRAGIYFGPHEQPFNSQTELFTLSWSKTY
ncbi:MAG: hypothetical protein ACKOCD_01145 [Nitrospiraceae bacterium]